MPVGTTLPSSRPSVLRLCVLVRSRVGAYGGVKRRRHISALAVASRACHIGSQCAVRFFSVDGGLGLFSWLRPL